MRRPVFAVLVFAACAMACSPIHAANRIVIGQAFNGGCGQITLDISVENDVSISTLSLPLVARRTSGATFWKDSVTLLGPLGRMVGTMNGIRLLETSLTDFGSPDQINIHLAATGPGDCFPSGGLETVFQLQFDVSGNGDMEIDTTFYPPCSGVEMIDCNTHVPVTIDQFAKGSVSTFPNDIFPTVQNALVSDMAGATLQNQVFSNSGDPVGFRVQSGPGEIDPVTGLWTWESCRRDTGSHTVQIETYFDVPGCGPGTGPPVYFTAQVTPHDPGDLNCDGQPDALDLNALIDYLFFNQPLDPCPQ